MVQPDDPRGALVRPYAVTRGRTEPRRDIPIEAVLVASESAVAESRFAWHDKHRIAVRCQPQSLSLAEIAAHCRLPLGVTRVLVADMSAEGLMAVHDPMAEDDYDDRMDLLERVLSGLRQL